MLTLAEKVKYDFANIDRDELVDALQELETWQNMDIGDPSGCKEYINVLEENQKSEDDIIDLKLLQRIEFHSDKAVRSAWKALLELSGEA